MTPPTTPEADSRHARGARGEELAVQFLRAAGYRIEARDLRTRDGEIDVLARRRRTWIAVEVKTRTHHPAPERAVSARQLARTAAALRALAPGLRPRPRALRVDVIAVRILGSGATEVRHFPGRPSRPGPR